MNQHILNDVTKAFGAYFMPRRDTTMQALEFNMISDHAKEKQTLAEYKNKKFELKLLDGAEEPLLEVFETCKTYEASAANEEWLDQNVNSPMEVTPIHEEKHRKSTRVAAVKRSCLCCGQTGHSTRLWMSPENPIHSLSFRFHLLSRAERTGDILNYIECSRFKLAIFGHKYI